MSWYDTEGFDEARVLWSRVTFYRNLSKLPFSSSGDRKTVSRISGETEALLLKNGFHKAEDDGIRMLSYAEKQYCSSGFTDAFEDGALFLNEPCSLSVSVGGRDMFCIQSVLSGKAVREAHRIASHAEELLDKNFDLAYSKKYGYLSATLSHSGHGMSMGCALFLPALSQNDMIGSEKELLSRMGFELYPWFTYKDNPGDILLLLYTPSVSVTEHEAIGAFESCVDRIISIEEEYEKLISADNIGVIRDRARRAFGVMEYALSVGAEEFLSLISSLRLCLLLEGDELYGISFSDLNGLLCGGMSASIVCDAADAPRNAEECDALRAAFLHSFLSERKKSV